MIGAPLIMVKPVKAQTSQPLPEFDKIKADGAAKIELIIADRYSVYSESSKAVQVTVSNGTLLIDDIPSGQTLKVYTKTLTSIVMDGITTIESSDTINTANFTITMDGSTKANLLVAATNITVNQDGSTSLTLAGYAKDASIKMDGAAKLKAENLKLNQANVETDGIAFAKVNVTNNLMARTDGSSSLRFVGTPVNKMFAIDGASTIKSIDEKEDYTDNTGVAATNNDDTTRVSIGGKKLIIIDDKNKTTKEVKTNKMKKVYSGFELGINGFTTPDLNFSLANTPFLNTKLSNSWFYGLNLFELDGHIIKNKLALTTGLGMTWSNYHFETDSQYLTPKSGTLTATPSNGGLSLNKLYTYDLNAPVLIKFAPGKNKNPKKGFHLAVGAIFRYMATTQVITESDNGKQRVELRDDFNINPFRVDATVRVGYNKVKLFANYALTPYFNSSAAPDIRSFSAGLTLVGF